MKTERESSGGGGERARRRDRTVSESSTNRGALADISALGVWNKLIRVLF